MMVNSGSNRNQDGECSNKESYGTTTTVTSGNRASNHRGDDNPILMQHSTSSSERFREETNECSRTFEGQHRSLSEEDPVMEGGNFDQEEDSRTTTWYRHDTTSVAVEHSRESEIGDFMIWEFHCLQFSHDQLAKIACKPFTICKIEEQFDVPRDKMSEFVKVVQSHYHKENPFHNFYHAVDTLHAAFLISTTTSAQYSLESLDLFSIFIAALCHDIDHPGHSQNLEIKRESKLAILYNDTAVLESYHANKTFEVLKTKSTNILCNLSQNQYQYCRKSIITSILGTDMSKHFTMLHQLDNYAKEGSPKLHQCDLQITKSSLQIVGFNPMSGSRKDASLSACPTFDPGKDSDRLELAKCIVHTADLSGQAAPYEQAKEWGSRIVHEFRNERELHEKEGFTPPAFTQNIDSCCQELMTQSSFIENIVLPLWQSMHEIVGCLEVPVTHLRRNKDLYESEAAMVIKR